MNRTSFLLSDAPHGALRGDVYLPADPRGVPVVVACHGFKGFKDWGFWPETGRRLAKSGLAVVTFNVSGSGIGDDLESFTEVERFQRNTISRELDDLARILEAVGKREIPVGAADVRRLGLLGHSRGGGVVLVRAGRDPRIGAVVTWAAVSTFQRWSEEEAAAWRERGYLPVTNARTGQVFHLSTDYLDDLETHGDAYSPLAAIARSEVPTLLVHGTRDESVPPQEAEALHRAARPGLSRVILVPGAGHTFGAVHPFRGSTPELDLVLDRTAGWFAEHLG